MMIPGGAEPRSLSYSSLKVGIQYFDFTLFTESCHGDIIMPVFQCRIIAAESEQQLQIKHLWKDGVRVLYLDVLCEEQ